MQLKTLLPLVILCATACQGVPAVLLDNESDMNKEALQESKKLAAGSTNVIEERREFIEKLRHAGKEKRPLYEEYFDVIGADGILDGIEQVWPRCHEEAHDAGRAIFARFRDIGASVRICADRCATGCMHGALMEAFGVTADDARADGATHRVAITPEMNEACYRNAAILSLSRPGNCAHGIGHALMIQAHYRIPEALTACTGFPEPAMRYYCVTGAYMEYVTEYDQEDAKSKSLQYPCDTYDYPAACARNKMYYVTKRHYEAHGRTEELVQECSRLMGKFRLGCFHGLGNAHMWLIASGQINIKSVCGHGTDDERFMCLEGAMERMGQHYETRALAVCEELQGQDRQTCLAAVKHKMYDLTKDFTLYLSE